MADTQKKPRKMPDSTPKSETARRNKAEAGAKNLERWRKAHPGEAGWKHGLTALTKESRIPANPEAVRKVDKLIRAARKELRTRGPITVKQEIALVNLRIGLLVAFIGGAYFEREGIATASGAARSLTELVSRFLMHSKHALNELGLSDLPRPVSVEDELAELQEQIANAER